MEEGEWNLYLNKNKRMENEILQTLQKTKNKLGIRKRIKRKIRFLEKIGFGTLTGIDPVTHVSMILVENGITALDF